jgi:Mg-chelatase subunit ChlD
MQMRYPASIAAVFVFTALGLTAEPVMHGAQSRPTFRAGVDLVVLAVSVTDADGSCVRGLQRSDFIVAEEGVRRPIELFSTDYSPLDVAVLVDASASMKDQMQSVRDAAAEFVSALQPDDSASVYTFQMGMRAIDEQDVGTIKSDHGATALYDSIYVGIHTVASSRARVLGSQIRQRAVIVLSDGVDTDSTLGIRYVEEAALQEDVALYPILLQDNFQSHSNVFDVPASTARLKRLARQTGGMCFRLNKVDEMPAVYRQIRNDLGERYLLGFRPSASHDGFTPVHVQVLRGGVSVRTRAGYMATGSH